MALAAESNAGADRLHLPVMPAEVRALLCEVERRLVVDATLGAPDAILADLGMSTFALDDPARGFSYRNDGPLDMRMDPASPLSAYDLLNEEGEDELERIIREFGEERAARRIARAIVEVRRRRPLTTTAELRAVIE